MNFNKNLENIRNKLTELNADYILISINNSFGNFENNISGLDFACGFSGSNGKAILSKNSATLLTDGRYIKQASNQIDLNNWNIEMYPKMDTLKIISKTIKKDQTLAISTFSISYKSMISIIDLADNIGFNIQFLDKIIFKNQKTSNINLFLMDEKNTGESRKNRINKVQDTLLNNKDEYLLISNKSLIGWIFGIRLQKPNQDKSVLPNILALFKNNQKPIIFCDLKLDSLNLSENQNDFEFYHIDQFEEVISKLKEDINIINLDFENTLSYFPIILKRYNFNLKDTRDTTKNYTNFESIKNKTEIENHKIASDLTSIAFIKTLALLEENNTKNISEIDAIDYFTDELKKNNEDFIDLSFNAISAFKNNTSIIHYDPKKHKVNKIIDDGLFLFDAGANFKNSTTDLTRTIYIGENPTYNIKRIYSIVLKSVIAFSTLKFPKNTYASHIDSIARFNIWKEGLDYNFGTGHGIGTFANVHENPRISQNSKDIIDENMIFTVEPGIYNDTFGIRLENILLSKYLKENNDFIELETISYIPFCRKLIIYDMFDKSEIDWINNYHQKTLDKFEKTFENDNVTLNWLKKNTQKI